MSVKVAALPPSDVTNRQHASRSLLWSLVETLLKIAVDMVWYLLAAYAIALVINTIKVGTIFGKLPWQ